MELFRLLGIIAIKNDEAKKALDDTSEKGNETHSKLSGAFEKIGGAAVKVGKTMAVGLAAGSAAIAGIAKSALDGYANYEQLVGGVETLFGAGGKSLKEYAASVGKTTEEVSDKYYAMLKAQGIVLQNADQAYVTAGMSANEYMETVTSFSASLIQSLDGDTVAAAEKANRAISDMSDNANKMGSSMESIQNAYNGFAKQNYTMLDNLKLGYGGTKEEMARLIADAAKMKDVQEELGVTIDASSMSFGNIVDAISVMQKSMGIMGTTAKEAKGTISGSIASMKSAWSNLVAGMGNDQVNLSKLIDEFVESVLVTADNILPRIQIILEGISIMIAKFMPILADKLPALIGTMLPSLIKGATALISGLIVALPSILQLLVEQIPSIFMQIGAACVEMFPVLLSTVQDLTGQLVEFVGEKLFGISIDSQAAFSEIGIWFSKLWEQCVAIWKAVGQPIWDLIAFAVGSASQTFKQYMPIITSFFQTAIADIKDTWENHLKPVFEAIGNFLTNVVKPAFEFVWQAVIEPLIETTFGRIADLWKYTLKPIFDGICDFLLGVFTLDWKTALNGILNIVIGIFNNICRAIEKPMELAKNIVNSAIEYIKNKFNFQWSLPKLKLPHFRISGSFSLNPPSVPSFGIDWYAKAMNDPIIMNSPTAFGINSLGQIMAGGEAGSEVVSGTDTLMNMIASAVASRNNALVEAVNEGFANLMAMLSEYLPEMANMQLVTDTGALIGELAPGMDDALGILAMRKERGI